MKTESHLIQHKDITKTHTLKVTDLEDLWKNSMDEGLNPMYVIDTPKRRWVMLTEMEWMVMQEVIRRYVPNEPA